MTYGGGGVETLSMTRELRTTHTVGLRGSGVKGGGVRNCFRN